VKATRDELERGILFWTIDGTATLRVGVRDPETGREAWSSPLSDPDGSKVDIPPGPQCNIRLRPADRAAIERPFTVRLERLIGHFVVTAIWEDKLAQPPVKLVHIPNYGLFHRLVVGVPGLDWGEDHFVIANSVRIRLFTGKVEGERAPSMDQIEEENGRFGVTGPPIGKYVADGRFIEIIAPGVTREEAEFRAYALLGLIALSLGDHAVGQVFFSEVCEALNGQQYGSIRVPVTAQFPRRADDSEVGRIDDLLPLLSSDDRESRARLLALHWFERGVRAFEPLDRLLSFFIGIETIVNAFAADNGPVPEEIEREGRLNTLLARIAEEVEKGTYGRLRQKLLEPSLNERFRFFANHHGLSPEDEETFRAVARARSEAVHGEPVNVSVELVGQAKRLLVRLLRATFGIFDSLPWEQHPSIRGLILDYGYITSPRDETTTASVPEPRADVAEGAERLSGE